MTAQTPIGAAQALAAGAGSAWVSTAGATRGGHAARLGVQRRRRPAARARRADRLRPPAAGRLADVGHARDGGRDPLRAAAARLPGGQVTPSATARATTRPRRPATSSTAAAPRTRTPTPRADDLVAVIGPYNSCCAADRDPDPQPRAGRPAGDDQPVEHLRRAHARGTAPPGRSATAASRTSTTRPATRNYVRAASPATTCRARRMRVLAKRLGLRARLRARRRQRYWQGRSPTRSASGDAARRPDRRLGDVRPAARRATPRSPTGSRAPGADGVVIGGDPFDGRRPAR